LQRSAVVTLGAVLSEDSNSQHMLLFLLIKNNHIGKSIVGDELFYASFVNDLSTLTLFLC
jgi:hypothetical protein